MTGTFATGFALGFSLILAIGAQNAFVLRQGLRRSHVFAVCLTCALSDAILIAAGVAGFGALAEALPWLKSVMTWGGAIFLFIYGAMAFRSALKGTSALQAATTEAIALWPTLLVCLALTWGNPHVYLDTLVLVGSVAAGYEDRLTFGAGAVTASFVFFFGLGYGARLLAPIFVRPAAWRILDAGVGTLMWALAAALIRSLF